MHVWTEPVVAVVGAPRNPKDFSRTVLEALRDHGCDAVPVNAKAAEAASR